MARIDIAPTVNRGWSNVDAPPIRPAVVEPLLEFRASVEVKDIDIEFTLARQSGESEVAASEKADSRIVRISPMAKIEFGVQSVSQKEFHDNFLRFDLPTKGPRQVSARVVSWPCGGR
jgi:hypothetical protein